jgi:hypothetical protein
MLDEPVQGPLVPRGLTSPRFALGLAAIVVGVLFLGRNLDWYSLAPWRPWWPALILVLATTRLLRGATAQGLLWLAIGGGLLANNLLRTPISFGHAVVPLVLVAVGVLFVTRAVSDPTATAEGTGATIQGLAVMGGVVRTNRSRAFRGGEVTAVMGGAEIDLRGAELAAEGATIDILAFWGGVEIYVPRGWQVDCRVIPFMGGVDDTTRPDAVSTTATDDTVPRLLVRGLALMGGVQISHEPNGR